MLKPDLAAKCFNENRNLFGNPQTAPEKFNLYNGLENMAVMVQELILKIDRLEREVSSLRNDLNQHR